MSLKSRPRTAELEPGDVDVLVVDDDAVFAASLRDAIEQQGLVAVAAGNGAEALRLARDRPPRLILLDLEMPMMNGWQFLERRRASRVLSSIPVVVVSAIASSVAERHRDDVDAILEKPIDQSQLWTTLGMFLPEGAPGQAPAIVPAASGPLALVVEDDDDTRASVCELLEDHGYRVARARNGQEAESYLHGGPRPDCIVLDLWMPVMDGWRFTSRLQQLGGPPIPIVVTTAAESYWGYPVPLAHVMRKPVHADTLIALLHKLLPAPVSEPKPPRVAPRAAGGRHRSH